MTWTDLGDPLPRQEPRRYQTIQWDIGEVYRLPVCVLAALTQPFSDVLDARMTVRRFGVLDDLELAQFLWHACRTRGVGASDLGFDLEHRAAPSAGAIHPIHVVLKRPGDSRWWLYQPITHELLELKKARLKFDGLFEHSQAVMSQEQATCILFLAEPGKTLGKYQNGCSLVWRDAGVLLGVMALTAVAQGLSFCPLGITGEPWASSLADQGQLAGVGLAFLGTAAGA
ncbi:nitroreductase family protein [Pseudomonas sp. YQ_6]|uniref:nitroreductase family protein n=1 Tax=unclassified Pseudomonas TaxID=196821 RepID=UPI0025601956|nr:MULTISPECIES: nitroreductase family protein [unclassified Pseudomonas]EKT4493103.1 nitroreductase family protein [Pseudomonas putida]EKT8864101.1 nitroreductase family protein [Pseudomonas putida]